MKALQYCKAFSIDTFLALNVATMSIRDPEQGDAPFVYTAKLSYMTGMADYFT
ncbi:hypothetical protein [Polluticoccus soli]|uniref:hypothetical protein n=1 Tax=Polluticoccus soli TaxID=3034150 RepID=UPI0023E1F0C5|nr:hypothetical protein [Flavipsychrobacter sp. JY13-12]